MFHQIYSICIWRLFFIINAEWSFNYLLLRKSSASLPHVFRASSTIRVFQHACTFARIHELIHEWFVNPPLREMPFMGLASPGKVLVVNPFRIYFREPSADYSWNMSDNHPAVNRHWNIIFLRMNLQTNSLMNLFRASLPQVFRRSSAPLPRRGEMLRLWRCGKIIKWLALWLPLRG